MKIEDFKSTFRNGFAVGNRYQVILPQIPGSSLTGQDLNIMCDSVAWPGRQIKTFEHATSMRENARAYAFGVEPLSISFILGNDWRVWDYLNLWQNMIIDHMEEDDGEYFVGFKQEYERDITVYHMDTAHTVRKGIIAIGAFPTTLSSMEFGNGAGEVLRVTSTFSYDYWKPIVNSNF